MRRRSFLPILLLLVGLLLPVVLACADDNEAGPVETPAAAWTALTPPRIWKVGPEETPAATPAPTLAPTLPSETSVETDRAALVALYNATDGPNWPESHWGGAPNRNWLTDQPLGEWHGVTTDANGRVTELDLTNVELRGNIPPEIGNLSELRRLGLWGPTLTGPIPPELGNLSRLTELILVKTNLSGPIPPELGNLSNLTVLMLAGGRRTPPLPGDVDDIVAWRLENREYPGDGLSNGLSGPIPPELGNLSRLTELNLQDNYLTGSIPAELGNLSNLTELRLSENSLTGAVPAELGRLANLESLELGYNYLTGPLPAELGNLSNLVVWYSYNPGLCRPAALADWSGAIKDSYGPACPPAAAPEPPSTAAAGETDRMALMALYNAAGGPQWRFSRNWRTDNPLESWHGVSTDAAGRVTALALSDNNLRGTVPPELGDLAHLETLYLFRNELTGQLPAGLATQTRLRQLSFANNDGLCAPRSWADWLDSSENFYGPLCLEQTPGLRGDRAALVALYNATNGPEWTASRHWLSNRPLGEWYGVVTDDNGRVIRLELTVHIHHRLTGNNLTGELPPELGNLSELVTLDLRWSSLAGEIPPELGQLSNLAFLFLAHNNLSGSIPPELGRLSNLAALELAGNNLSGPIPPELGNLHGLDYIELNSNQLTGQLPPSFTNIPNLGRLAFDENAGLCAPAALQVWLGGVEVVHGPLC